MGTTQYPVGIWCPCLSHQWGDRAREEQMSRLCGHGGCSRGCLQPPSRCRRALRQALREMSLPVLRPDAANSNIPVLCNCSLNTPPRPCNLCYQHSRRKQGYLQHTSVLLFEGVLPSSPPHEQPRCLSGHGNHSVPLPPSSAIAEAFPPAVVQTPDAKRSVPVCRGTTNSQDKTVYPWSCTCPLPSHQDMKWQLVAQSGLSKTSMASEMCFPQHWMCFPLCWVCFSPWSQARQ